MKRMIQDPVKTKKGLVYIESKTDGDFLKDLIFPFKASPSSGYKPLYSSKQILEEYVEKGGSLSLALFEHKIIVGFALLHDPDEKERWIHFGRESIMELKAVEVSREFRNYGIARQLLAHLFSCPFVEEKIIYLTAYSWIWDLAYSGHTIQTYRNMLMSLYSPFGFTELKTNEPNICLRPENIFMVRMGKKVSEKVQNDFRLLRYGIFS